MLARRAADAAVFLVDEFTSAATSPDKVAKNEADLMRFAEAISEGAGGVLRSGRLAGPFPASGGGEIRAGSPFYLGFVRTELGQVASAPDGAEVIRVLGRDVPSVPGL